MAKFIFVYFRSSKGPSNEIFFDKIRLFKELSLNPEPNPNKLGYLNPLRSRALQYLALSRFES